MIPPVVLGLCAFTHDSAASLLVDGSLVGMVEEERLSGVKHTKAYPTHAMEWLLMNEGLDVSDVNLVAYNFDGIRYLGAIPGSVPLVFNRSARPEIVPRMRGFTTVYGNYRRRMRSLRRQFPNASIRAIQHHRAHGLYAFAASGLDDAAVLVVDSLGEHQTTSIAEAHREGSRIQYRQLQAIRDPASLGYAYGAITQHLGWRRGDEEGTVMALAALGDPDRFRALFEDAIPMTRTGFTLNPFYFPVRTLLKGSARVTPALVASTCPPRHAEDPVEQTHADMAAALQERTEVVMVHLAERARRITSAANLCVGGGVAMNCLSIGRILASGIFEGVTVPPAPGDSGTAIGAAIAAQLDATQTSPKGVAAACYLGPSPASITSGLPPDLVRGLIVTQVRDPADFLARELTEGAIVGLVRGRAEAGPRALGNRSILASPLLPNVVDRLNRTVKFREPFRPFAPAVLEEHAREYFVLDQPSPYMSIAVPGTELGRRRLPSIFHLNETARVQTVSAIQNRFLYAVLTRFNARTGVPVLINTSLNVKGKPICGTLESALQCLRQSGLDALMLEGGIWVTKDGSE